MNVDLLEKFNAVNVKAGSRISEADRDYCERHQAAYESALTSYAELLRISKQLEEAQATQLGGEDAVKRKCYLLSTRDVTINEYSVARHLENLSERFSDNIVEYFCKTYEIHIDGCGIQRALQKESESEVGQTGDVANTNRKTPLRYETIIDLIFREMDGRSFEEFAMHQLKAGCRNAVGVLGGSYERKKAVICFRDHFCYASTRNQYGYTASEWQLQDRAKFIIRALAHFESGKFAVYPGPTAHMISNGSYGIDLLAFYGCAKLEELKLFKNGRMDIRFASAALAAEFEETYLRKTA